VDETLLDGLTEGKSLTVAGGLSLVSRGGSATLHVKMGENFAIFQSKAHIVSGEVGRK
jgi:hypothetical protein